MVFLAHSANDCNRPHLAKEHLTDVARLAVEFSGGAEWGEEANLAGVLHDLGKYADLFQARLRGEAKGLDHWSPGAWLALSEFQAVAAALAIQGHHIGLQQGGNGALRMMKQATPNTSRLSDEDFSRLKARLVADGLLAEKPTNPVISVKVGFQSQISSMLDVRMLFSCLTDADFLDTEAHFEGDEQGKRYREAGPKLNAAQALTALDHYMSGKIRSVNKADKSVLDARNALWNMVTTAAAAVPGLLTLTAPTGSGKTLAMLKFALEHVRRNGLKRIVLVVPFLSIIEQTAEIYRSVFQNFPGNFVLEHHSLAGLGSEEATGDAEAAAERARRLLAENWDAPIIITTNVQLLESLFSNRPSACRKLHNLMESVIMFDEAQTLPQSLAVPTLAALSHLSRTYRTTVLFATATQPAFDALDGAVAKLVYTGWRPVEAAPDHARLYGALRRYEVDWPDQGESKKWTTLAAEIRAEEQVLCVVNLKSHAAALLEEMKHDEAVFHLSTNLCALHRRAVLDEVRARLKSGQSCRLISTQCIEAGVDVDFPVVYRALAPLDAIAQAAGRCNREGRLADDDGNRKMGEVRVFEPDVAGDYRKRYPTRPYFQAAEVTRSMLTIAGKAGLDLNEPAVFRDYYHRLYDLTKPETQNRELTVALTAVDFVRVAKEYRLIDQSAIQLLVPYDAGMDRFNELRRQQEEEGINAQWIRRAQGLTVSVFRPRHDHPAWGVLIPAKLRYGQGVSDEWFILEDRHGDMYDDVFGLRLPQSQQILIG
ncbi:CRISPR-associated helicase/endonuclease Cas3 [Trichloromonas acetexigens]|uniref:CRISPR-associated helicase/endonuclease Cas3 n=1 Tax=Trichloromonas acetexigens TaxID=38815 RepID=A0A550JKJ0_9BACT|nr:CRISPR-associated helicase/endonuclease Cas3 [Desulfuromonas acetexigens]TRO83697.1 CRISPR-associated helicase/endonuclease Cas3 [Desulfuromonas acetexigens]